MSSHDANHLTYFDAVIVIVAVLVATLLMLTRRARGVDHKARQWLDDAVNVGTLIVLAALVLSSFPWWIIPFSATPTTDIALIYCGGVIWTAMYRTIQKPQTA